MTSLQYHKNPFSSRKGSIHPQHLWIHLILNPSITMLHNFFHEFFVHNYKEGAII